MAVIVAPTSLRQSDPACPLTHKTHLSCHLQLLNRRYRCIYTYMESEDRLRDCAVVAEACLAFNLRRATRLLTQLYDAVLRPSGLRITQFSMLVAIGLGGSVPLQVLAEMLGMDRTTLTRNLKGLSERGLVSALTGEDRRSRLISLTDKGRQALDQALPLWRQAQQIAVESLGQERVSQLMPVLAEISQTAPALAAEHPTIEAPVGKIEKSTAERSS